MLYLPGANLPPGGWDGLGEMEVVGHFTVHGLSVSVSVNTGGGGGIQANINTNNNVSPSSSYIYFRIVYPTLMSKVCWKHLFEF